MLEVDHVDLHYGAAIALRQVSLKAEIGASPASSGATAWVRRRCCAPSWGRIRSRGAISNGKGRASPSWPLYERARRGIAWVPQGRDIFPLLTVKENLETGFAVLPRGERRVPDEMFELFPILKTMMGRRGGDLSGGQQQQLAIARALVTKPRLLVLGRADRGHPAEHHQGYRPGDLAVAVAR